MIHCKLSHSFIGKTLNIEGIKMSTHSIAGYGDQLTVNGIRIGDLSTADHETIEKEKRKQRKTRKERNERDK